MGLVPTTKEKKEKQTNKFVKLGSLKFLLTVSKMVQNQEHEQIHLFSCNVFDVLRAERITVIMSTYSISLLHSCYILATILRKLPTLYYEKLVYMLLSIQD